MGLLKNFGIQLYSVKEETKADFRGTLVKLAKMGYTGVEFAGYGGLSGHEMKKILDDNGLKSIGSHVKIEALTTGYDETAAFNKTVGSKYLICPWANIRDRESALEHAKIFNEIAERCEKDGFVFAYHNHEFEFSADGGEHPLDVLIANTTDKVKIELDLYWVAYAGLDAAAYMEKIKDRLEMLHIKQIGSEKQCVDLPDGLIDYKAIIALGLRLGVKEFVLEQEEFEVSSDISLKRNIEFIHSL